MKRRVHVLAFALLLALGLPLGALADDPPAPVARHVYRVAGLSASGPMEVVTFINEFQPGAQTPVHTHPGQVVVTVIAGENSFITEGKTTVYKTGDSFVELPGVVGQARNAGSAPMAVMATFLLPQGEPLSHPVAPAPPATGTGGALPGLPGTGGGGAHRSLAVYPGLGLAALGALALIGGGCLLRRRVMARRD